MGSDRICYHTVAMSTASLFLVAGCCRIRIQLTNTKHNAFLLLCLSHAARCSIAANFDDAGTGLLARFFMCIVVRCSFLLLGGTAIFADTAVSHRSSAFLFSQKRVRLASSLHCCFSLHLPMGIVVGKGAGYFDDAESPTIDVPDAACACFADCGK